MKDIIWYNKSIDEIEGFLDISADVGLSEEESKERIDKYGYNEIEGKGRKSIWSMILDQFKDFMVIVLLVAALISRLLGEKTDAIIILIIVILNAVIGVIQENKAEESLLALKKMSSPHARVRRGDRVALIEARDLVPGDLVNLETGDFVPADIRLINLTNLQVEEAQLTGESLPVEKNVNSLDEEDLPLGDRFNMAYSGSLVTYGRGSGIVVGTGMNTEMGRIASLLDHEEEVQTPLQKRLASLGKLLAIGALAICGIIFLIGILYGRDLFDMFFISVSLAVAAIPEGLPAIVTIVLAIGVQRLAKKNAIIRSLPAVETLGSATVICSDKTGTLTQNKMTITELYFDDAYQKVEKGSFLNSHHELLVYAGVLCNNSQISEDGSSPIGDPTETAFIDLGIKYDVDKISVDNLFKRIYEKPFDSESKVMMTGHKVEDRKFIYSKGASDELLSRCNRILIGDEIRPLRDEDRDKIIHANEAMASKALRVLALAYKELEVLEESQDTDNYENDLVFIGLAGMIDPPREEAKNAVKLCKRAGIKPVMITGDHKITALAIAKELGIYEDEDLILTGKELEQLSDDDLREVVKKISVYARVAPEHKVRIVKAWQDWDQVVAMTGDGVNDAPALKRADIGAAMGIVGTDVAKEASDMVLTDDNFNTIVLAVEEGRTIYNNILKSIQFLLSCNIGEILLLFIATLFNWNEPLLPVHILWVNLVTDSLPALALGVEPAEKDIMEKKPRLPGKSIFEAKMVTSMIYQGSMIGLLSLIAYLIGIRIDLITARTMSFGVLALSQLVHVFNTRSNDKSLFSLGLFTNSKLILAVFVSAILQIGVMVIPGLNSIFKVGALSIREWGVIVLLSFAPLLIVEFVKLIQRGIKKYN